MDLTVSFEYQGLIKVFKVLGEEKRFHGDRWAISQVRKEKMKMQQREITDIARSQRKLEKQE